jgi:D-alanyl-D-alanine dipeptidase
MRKLLLTLVAFAAFVAVASAQEIPKNEYGLRVVNDYELYTALTEADPDKRLVDLAEAAPDVEIDMRYATENNFMGKAIYRSGKAYLRAPAAAALSEANAALAEKGFGLKVLDAYRPYTATVEIWEHVQDARYAARPSSGSRHNRGCAVDVTLVVLATGEEAEMPSAFDDFSERAHQNYAGASAEAIENRRTLREAMKSVGFTPISSEWWHYDFRGWKNFELIDVPIETLEKRSAD